MDMSSHSGLASYRQYITSMLQQDVPVLYIVYSLHHGKDLLTECVTMSCANCKSFMVNILILSNVGV